MIEEINNKNSISSIEFEVSENDSVNSLIGSNMNSPSLNKYSPIKNNFISKKGTSKRIGIQTNPSILMNYSNLSQEQFYKKGLELFKNPKRDINENQVVIDFLMNLNPFAQGIKEVKKENFRDLFSCLSFTLKHKYFEKNKIIYKYNDDIDNFYLVLKGKVDILVPNEEYVKLTEQEYFIYLLKLRKYGEKALLQKTLNKNNDQYPMNEQNFDIWIKRAYITIQNYNMKMKYRFQSTKSSLYNRNSILKQKSNKKNAKKIKNSPIKAVNTFQPRFSLIKNSLKQILPFEKNDEKDLVLSIQDEIIDTFKYIDNNITIFFEKNYEKEHEIISTEDYINRIKPVSKEEEDINDFLLDKKDILISNYFIAESLGPGEKFGEELSDINYLNENKRVETIISSKNTDLAFFSIELYNDILKEISEKTRREKMNFLLGLTLFKNNDKFNNLRTFTNYFKQKICKYKEILYNENDPYEKKNFIYFIQRGEFETKANKSIIEMDEILNCTSYKKKLTEINDIENLKEFFIQRELKLESFGENDIIGLSDCVFNNKYLFTVSCKTNNSIIYEINITFFKTILNISPIIKERLMKMQKMKNDVITSLLFKQRESAVEYIKTKYKFVNGGRKKLKYSKKKFIKKIERPLSERKEGIKHKIKKSDIQSNFSESMILRDRIHLKQKSDFSFKLSSFKKRAKNHLDIDILMRDETTKTTSKINFINNFNTLNDGLSVINKKLLKKKENSKNDKFDIVYKKKIISAHKTIKINSLPNFNSQEIIFNNNNFEKKNIKNNIFLNPLVYDDFNRNYNTFRYFKPSKEDLKINLYCLEISSAITRKTHRRIFGKKNSNINVKTRNKYCLSK